MLSIVYITCNRAEEIITSIMSCENHVSVNHEYIVVDNGSTDDTEDRIKSLSDKGMPITYLKQETNKGVSGGRNIGFKAARGEICYFIDDDATVISEGMCLDAAYEYLLQNDNVLAMGTDCYDTMRKCRLVANPMKGSDINTITPILSYVGCSHFIKKKGRRIKFLYPDNLIYGSEELYGGVTCYKEGGIVVQFPYVKVLHCPSTKTRSNRDVQKRNGHINTYVIKKYYLPSPYLLLSRALFVLRILRFEKLNIRNVVDDYITVKERYNSQYRNTLTRKQLRKLVDWFGLKSVI